MRAAGPFTGRLRSRVWRSRQACDAESRFVSARSSKFISCQDLVTRIVGGRLPRFVQSSIWDAGSHVRHAPGLPRGRGCGRLCEIGARARWSVRRGERRFCGGHWPKRRRRAGRRRWRRRERECWSGGRRGERSSRLHEQRRERRGRRQWKWRNGKRWNGRCGRNRRDGRNRCYRWYRRHRGWWRNRWNGGVRLVLRRLSVSQQPVHDLLCAKG